MLTQFPIPLLKVTASGWMISHNAMKTARFCTVSNGTPIAQRVLGSRYPY